MKQARKLLKEKQKLQTTTDEDQEQEEVYVKRPTFSAFALLEEEENHNEEENIEETEEPKVIEEEKPINELYGEDIMDMINEKEEEENKSNKSFSSKKKKNNKKKNKKKEKSSTNKKEEDLMTDEEFLQKQIEKLQLESGVTSSSSDSNDTFLNQLFLIKDVKALNPENEFMKIFGKEAVQQANKAMVDNNLEEQLPKSYRNNPHYHGHKQVLKTKKQGNYENLFVSLKGHWPRYMSLYLTPKLKSTKSNQIEIYEIVEQQNVSGKSLGLYSKLQQQYESAIQSHDPDSFVYILQRLHPYHLHTLLQLSEVVRTMHRENDQAQDLIERALYAIQNIFNSNNHFMSSLLNGKARLQSDQDVVKVIYLCILSRLHSLARSGAHHTAFDLCRLLLSISCDPLNSKTNIADPVHVLLFIDYYSIRIRKYQFIYKDLIEEFLIPQQPELQYLPNLMFSRALSLWKDNQLSKANEVLQEALRLWPMTLVSLLNETKTTRFSEFESVIRNTLFTTKICTSPIFSKLISAYVKRNFEFWKDPEVLDWLKYNVEEVLSNNIDMDKQRDELYQHPVFATNYSVVYEKELTGELLPDINTIGNSNQSSSNNNSSGRRNPFLYFLETLLPWTGNGGNTGFDLNAFLGGNGEEDEDEEEQ
ncbi:hypothetical protein ABK040_014405 [Willaertia magna]